MRTVDHLFLPRLVTVQVRMEEEDLITMLLTQSELPILRHRTEDCTQEVPLFQLKRRNNLLSMVIFKQVDRTELRPRTAYLLLPVKVCHQTELSHQSQLLLSSAEPTLQTTEALFPVSVLLLRSLEAFLFPLEIL